MLNAGRTAPSTPALLPPARSVPGPQSRLVALTAYASLLGALGLWLTLGHLAERLLAAGLAPLEIGFWRLLLAGGAFALHATLSRRAPRLASGDLSRAAALALLGVGAFYLILSLSWARGGLALYALPAALALLLWGPPLWQRPGWRSGLRRVNLLLLGVLAALLLWSGTGADLSPATLVLPLLLGASFAVYYRLGQGLLARMTPVALYALVLPLAAACLLPALEPAAKTPTIWLGLGLFAALSSYGLHGLYYLILSNLGVRRGALTASAEPVAASLVALLLFAPLSPLSLMSAAVVGAGLLAVPLDLQGLSERLRHLRSRAGAPRETGAEEVAG